MWVFSLREMLRKCNLGCTRTICAGPALCFKVHLSQSSHVLSGPHGVTVAFLWKADESVRMGFFLSMRGYHCCVLCWGVRNNLSVWSTDKIPILPSSHGGVKNTDPGILIQLKSSVIKTHYTVVSFFFKVCFLNRHDKQLSFSMLVLAFPLCLRTLVIKVCQRVSWVKSLGSWFSPISCRFLQSTQLFGQAQFMGCNDWSQTRLFGNSHVGIFCVYGVCQLSDTVKKLLSTNVAIPMAADMKRGEREERRAGQRYFAQWYLSYMGVLWYL